MRQPFRMMIGRPKRGIPARRKVWEETTREIGGKIREVLDMIEVADEEEN